MKRFLLLSIAWLCLVGANAQEPATNRFEPVGLRGERPHRQASEEEKAAYRQMKEAEEERQMEADATLAKPFDSATEAEQPLNLPLLNSRGQVISSPWLPFSWGGWSTWQLHEGLNLSLGASVFAQFGKHARHGAGFTQSLSAVYAMPLTDRLTLAVGGYMDHVTFAHDGFADAGLTAVLGYRFNDHWEAYIYGQKSLTNNRHLPYYLYGMTPIGDRIGAAVKYSPNPSLSIEVAVEADRLPKKEYWYDRTYNYPVP